MRTIEKIRQNIEQEVFDYTQLISLLNDYRKPRDAISLLLQKEEIIRIRKGLYIFGPLWRRKKISREALANLIYGPSFISLDYGLSYYEMIPEKVETVTSITSGRSRNFDTPLGRFSYTQISKERFSLGAVIKNSGQGNWLITEPLKTLADKVWTDKRFRPTSVSSYDSYLYDDLRIDRTALRGYFNIEQKKKKAAYKSRKIDWLAEALIKAFVK
jgi:hypothetical protein